jgi:signal transduction histidine kinase
VRRETPFGRKPCEDGNYRLYCCLFFLSVMSSVKTIFRLVFLGYLLLCIPPGIFASRPDREQDSVKIVRGLEQVLETLEKNDSLQTEHRFFYMVDSIVRLAEKNGLEAAAGYQLNRMGKQLRYEGRYGPAIRLHKEAIALGKKTGNVKLTIISYNNLGVVFRRIDSYQKAMEYHLKALRLATKEDDSVSTAIAINSIGNVYLMLGNFDRALRYFKQSLRLEKSRKNPIGIAINLNNIAHVYEKKGLLNKALDYYRLSLEIDRRIPSKRGIVICNNDISGVLKKQGKYRQALLYSQKAIRIANEIRDFDNLAYAYILTGSLYTDLKDYTKALQYLQPGIRLARKIRARSTLEEGYRALFETYLGMKDYPKAIHFLQLKQAYHDSLINLDVKKSIARLQIQFDMERQKSQIQLQQQKTKIAMLQVKKQKYLLYFAWSAFAVLLIFLVFVVYHLITKSRQNRLLVQKTKEIETTEQELKKSNKALQEAIKKAESNAKAKTDFLANFSHEIRTPLNSVIGFSDILCSMAVDEQQKSYLQAIKTSGESLLGLINDILDLSKIEEGNIDLEYRETDIRKVTDDVLGIFSLEASGKGLHLMADIEENVPKYLIFDEARLRQILLNLAGNAIKFTEQGSVNIHVFALPAGLPGKVDLTIEVRDTGPGISEEEQETIFIPFHQAQTSQKASGTGLGLAIVQRMVKALNGEIKLESEQGKGSCFTVVFHQVEIGSSTEDVGGKIVAPSDAEVKKCLFINEQHPLKAEIVQLFVSQGFRVEDVGLNLSKARKMMKDFRLIIFCCLSEEVLKNVRNIFEKENIENRYLFLILNINSEFLPDENKAVSIPVHSLSSKEMKKKLREFILQFEEDETARLLFFTWEPLPETFEPELQQIFTEYFLPAFHTKMFDKIEMFVQNVKQMAGRYPLERLQTFALHLENHLKDFDIVMIDRQMRVFQKAYDQMQSDK